MVSVLEITTYYMLVFIFDKHMNIHISDFTSYLSSAPSPGVAVVLALSFILFEERVSAIVVTIPS